eukprot:CAMPEP_0195302444 /NCGR_PEP_ID=MMETSP0707-20130614/31099_1 /TAXON_ID=33640 /ORGANISM="Asterionellopsis glacialis, Strain CCMP134" /LENGTH=190 /DNA_ID=CAMNT_0040365705 /DNA_START=99 /DNA_END=671 /DNA_ORIENTATION=+
MKVTKQRRGSKTLSKGVPKKPLTAYNLFFREERLNILKTASEAPRGCGTIARAIAAKWKSLDAVTRCQYEFKAQEERKMVVKPFDTQVSGGHPYQKVKVSSPTYTKPSPPPMTHNPFPEGSLPVGMENVFSFPYTSEPPALSVSCAHDLMKKGASTTTIDPLFQNRVSMSLQESKLDEDFVDFVLSLGFV